MDVQLIRIPPTRSPRTWQIPALTHEGTRGEREYMDDFCAYANLLTKTGFLRLLGVRSLKHGETHSGDRLPQAEEYGLWYHPAGILATGKSYTTGGWTLQDGTIRPLQQQLGSLTLYAHVDIGTGDELQHRAAVGLSCKGSGGVTPGLDGRSIRHISCVVHGNSSSSLADFLSLCQRHGKFLPISRWDPTMDLLGVPLSDELLAPFEQLPAPEPLDDEARDARFEAIKRQMPPEVAAVIRVRHELKNTDQGRTAGEWAERKGLRWDPVEFSINRFSEALFFAGKRWHHDFDPGLLTHWSRVALGEVGNDPAMWRAHEKGPAGLSLPVALLYAKPRAAVGNGQALIDVLTNAPNDVLRRWATEPDAAGYTLGLHALNRLFVENEEIHTPHPGLIPAVLTLLHERLGPEGLPMATQRRSVMGIPLQFKTSGVRPEAIAANLRRFDEALALLDGWGLPWHEHLRWRSYPNLFKKEEGKPRFFRLDGPVSAETWRQAMAERGMAAPDAILSRLAHKRLNQDVPNAEPSARRRGPRL